MYTSEIKAFSLKRRTFMTVAFAMAASAALPVKANQDGRISTLGFMALSSQLLQMDINTLDETQGQSIVTAIIKSGEGADLARLLVDPKSELALADKVINAWYTGLYSGTNGLTEVGYGVAVMWKVLIYTKPPGVCGGETGYWGKVPA